MSTALLSSICDEVSRRVDGAALVKAALSAERDLLGTGGPLHVLAFGKVAFPMFEGLQASVDPGRVAGALLVAPASRFPAEPRLPAGAHALISDHPTPSARSIEASRQAQVLVGALKPDDHLCVLISGGGSALMAAPAPGLTFDDKRAAVTAVARAGATIHELNAVRKHLSAIKGGQLGVATRARTTALALSDVIGNDPGTIASGPFSPDGSTFADALAIVRRLAPGAPAAVIARLEQGAAGQLDETPKPGDHRLAHVSYRLLAGPDRVADEARRLVEQSGRTAGVLSSDTELPVEALAAAYGGRARLESNAGGAPRVLVGNGEPTIVVTGSGRGGRATHLALLVARAIAGLPGVAFLAAGTDDRDGNSDACGAVVDGTTWARAQAAGLDPQAALVGCDSARPLEALGCLVRGPGRSNLLDLHLLAVGEPR